MLEDEVHGRKTSRFSLQWHLTHACDMHCKHCYDRTRTTVLKLDRALEILDDLQRFCGERGVDPNVLLSGGNPFFYPWFFELYEELARRGIRVGILGNPVPRETLERMLEIKRPSYFQVSLEGLEEHNDAIRGPGSFQRALDFLTLLRELGIRSIVMATLTDQNIDQLIPLGRLLEDRADRFNFNRLSQTGEGSALGLPDRNRYGAFMVEYMKAGDDDRKWGMKDNLFNIFRHHAGRPLTGGCTGYGCGAAFNFVAALPNGEVHACRKLPSAIGNLNEQSLAEIWDGEPARKYRRGCSDCDGCPIRLKCGGCLAVTAGHGLDPFTRRDPHCFMLRLRAVEGRGRFVRTDQAALRRAYSTTRN